MPATESLLHWNTAAWSWSWPLAWTSPPTWSWSWASAWPGITALLTLASLMATAAWVDLRQRRIPNRLVLLGALSALAQQLLLPQGVHPASAHHPGTPGLMAGLAAGLLMLLLAGSLWRLGFWGAGDAKWLTVLAAHAGPAEVGALLLYTALAGGLLAVTWKACRRTDRMPYALAIAAGEVVLIASLTTTGGSHIT